MPAESLLFISPLPGQGCGEHTGNRVYLPHPHVHHSPQVTRSGTRWSLALSLPSDCRLTTRVRGGREIPPPTQGYHQRSSHLNLSIFERLLSDLNQIQLGERMPWGASQMSERKQNVSNPKEGKKKTHVSLSDSWKVSVTFWFCLSRKLHYWILRSHIHKHTHT